MARPEIQGLKYFPFDVGFFRDKKIRLLRGEHGADGVEIYIRLVAKCFEDNGYYLPWDDNEDYALLAEETGFPESKVRGIMSTLFRRLLLCKLPIPGNNMVAVAENRTTLCGRSMAYEQTLPMPGNILTSRGIQRRYFSAIKDTKIKAAALGRYTFIYKDLCLLAEEDFSELNKTQVWLKVAQNYHNSRNNSGKSENNSGKSKNNPAKERKENESKLNNSVASESATGEIGLKKFIRPTVEEVAQYCLERNNGIIPEQFIDFYSAKNWYIGKNKMRDWQAAVRTWERNKKESDKLQPKTLTQQSHQKLKEILSQYDTESVGQVNRPDEIQLPYEPKYRPRGGSWSMD